MKTPRLFLRIALYLSLVILFMFSVGFASHRQAKMPCSGIRINIVDSINTGFVTEGDLLQSVKDKFGILEGKPIASINISLLEKIINTNPFIFDAEVFSTVDGKLNIEVKQRIPVLRVINYKNESFYIDKEGFFMPQSEKFTARVPVVNGFIYDREAEKQIPPGDVAAGDSLASKSKISQLFNIVSFTHKHELWNAEVQQLFVNEEGDIEFIPRVGNHTVILGDDQYLSDKFTRLFYFYKEGLNKSGWEKYKSINLKYKNQVVCLKK
jgi:cell division protein FtsQ